MDTSYIIFHLNGMTGTTINRFQIICMGKTFIGGIGVTGDTGVAVVNRVSKDGGVHKHGNVSPLKQPGQSAVLMAHHTILVSLRRNQVCKGSNKNE